MDNLLLACIEGRLEAVRLFLEHGADIHEQDDLALWHAIINNHVDVVKLLLEMGADPHCDGNSCFQLSQKEGYEEINKVLQEWLEKRE